MRRAMSYQEDARLRQRYAAAGKFFKAGLALQGLPVKEKEYELDVDSVSRAHFYRVARQRLFVELPDEECVGDEEPISYF